MQSSVNPDEERGSSLPFNSAWYTSGKHNIEWWLYAKTNGDWVEYLHDKVDYYVYTLPLDAIATEVLVVQGEAEKHWLAGTVEGFIESPVSIKPDTETYFKFLLSNAGDEPVKTNVGHLVNDHYETGFLVGGVLVDTIDKDIEIPAGETGEIKTEKFIASPGVLPIGSFVTLRTRHLEYSLRIKEGKSYMSLPMIPEDASPDAVFGVDVEVKGYDPVTGWYTPTALECGKGYLIGCAGPKTVTITGAKCTVTLDDLIDIYNALAGTPFEGYLWALVAPGIDVVSVKGTILEGHIKRYIKETDEWVDTDTLIPTNAYWMGKPVE